MIYLGCESEDTPGPCTRNASRGSPCPVAMIRSPSSLYPDPKTTVNLERTRMGDLWIHTTGRSHLRLRCLLVPSSKGKLLRFYRSSTYSTYRCTAPPRTYAGGHRNRTSGSHGTVVVCAPLAQQTRCITPAEPQICPGNEAHHAILRVGDVLARL